MKQQLVPYLKKHDHNPYEDLYWNLPEQPRGKINLIGGHSGNFQNVVRTAEWLTAHEPIAEVQVALPDALSRQLPPLPNLHFLPSTDTGSFSGAGLSDFLATADANLLIGDFSKNAITGKALVQALTQNASQSIQNTSAIPAQNFTPANSALSQTSATPKFTLATRDTIDLLADHQPEPILTNANLILLLTMAQLQKLLRAIFYPKMLTLTMPLTQVAEALHKFTLSYPLGIVTLHDGLLLAAKNGNIEATPLSNTTFTPISLWNGQLACQILTLNLFNPHNFHQATLAAFYQKPPHNPHHISS